MKNKNKKISEIIEILDEDPTDEIPILQLRAAFKEMAQADSESATGQRPALTPDGESQIAQRALATLSRRCEELEDDLRAGEAQMARLRSEMAARAIAIETLDTDLQAALGRAEALAAENARLAELADEQQVQLRQAEATVEQQSAELQAALTQLESERATAAAPEMPSTAIESTDRHPEIAQLQAELDAARRDAALRDAAVHAALEELQDTKAELEAMASGQTGATSGPPQPVLDAQEIGPGTATGSFERLEAAMEGPAKDLSPGESRRALKSAQLRIQDLEAYIAGRHADWQAMQAECERLRLSVASMEQAAQRRDARFEERETELAALQAALRAARQRAADLQTRLGELTSQAADKVRPTGVQTGLASERANELATELASSLARATAGVYSLNQRLDRQIELPDTVTELPTLPAAGPVTAAAASPPSDQALADSEAEHRFTRLMVSVSGERAVKYPLYKERMIIGRAPDSDIQISRDYISRHHARLENDDGGTFIEDLGSKNGVRVNALRVNERQQLRNGDLVDIGKMQFQFIDMLEPHSGHANA